MFSKGNGQDKYSSTLNGFIGKGVSVNGKLSFEGEMRIDGRFDGEIEGSGTLIIGEEALLEAKIKVENVLISGEVRGTIESATKIELMAPAKMYGDIKTPSLIISDGALFEGNCDMGGGSTVITHLPLNQEKGIL